MPRSEQMRPASLEQINVGGNFWSLGAGWNMHNEKWLRSKEWFSRLKPRASVGSTGSQGNNAYQSLATYNYSEKNYENKLGAYLMGMENKDLKWQKKMDYNVGMDMSVKIISISCLIIIRVRRKTCWLPSPYPHLPVHNGTRECGEK